MHLTMLDWGIVIGAMAITVVIGFLVSRRASKDSSSYFLGGRNMPWWLLGGSMVATTFAADTPNLVTNLVRTNGVAGNWVWWAFLITGMLTTFVYARLWRRLGVATDIEFYERRYSGRPAEFLRGFRALYLGLFFNVMIMGNVTLAAVKIGSVLFAAPPVMMVLIAGTITVVFSAVGGFLGVLITDMILFILSMVGSLLAAYYAVNHPAVGGLDALINNEALADKISLLPDMSDPNQWVPLLLIPLAVQWWSAWYPGAEPGGGGYIAQRMLAAKNENHALGASAFFNVAHYTLRPWPWILVALASIIVFPDLNSIQRAMPHVPASIIGDDMAYPAMLTFLPAGILGLVVASLASAYVSTISTHLNWGASYFVNDVYRRFIRPGASEKRLVWVGRLMTVALMVCASLLALLLQDAFQAFRLLLTIGAGTGLLFLLRWFWVRINVWSEVSAMVFSFLISLFFEFGPYGGLEDWQKFVLSVALTTTGWITVTLLTQATPKEKLDEFRASLSLKDGEIRKGLKATLLSTAAIYAVLFATGSVIFANYGLALGLFIVSIACGYGVRRIV
ncbi:MAG: Na+:solute symporter [Alphaproteobacteria bacterium]|nr:Na+:solute symporter [Alphaproteobacteria bacterium]